MVLIWRLAVLKNATALMNCLSPVRGNQRRENVRYGPPVTVWLCRQRLEVNQNLPRIAQACRQRTKANHGLPHVGPLAGGLEHFKAETISTREKQHSRFRAVNISGR